MPERYATPARLPRVQLSCAHMAVHAIGSERLTLAPNQRCLNGLDNGVTVGSGSMIWVGSTHARAHLAWRARRRISFSCVTRVILSHHAAYYFELTP